MESERSQFMSVLVSACDIPHSILVVYNSHTFLAHGFVGWLPLCWAQLHLALDRWRCASVSSRSRALVTPMTMQKLQGLSRNM